MSLHRRLDKPEADAVPELIVDAELDRLMLHTEQCERLMCEAIRRERPEAVAHYNRLAAAACAACLDLLTR